MASNTEYTKIKESVLSAFFTKLKAFFWKSADVVTYPLADVATTGSYNDLTDKPTISTNIKNDKTSDVMVASPKAVYDEVHPAIATAQPSGGFLPNVMYVLGELSGNTTFALASPNDTNVVNHYYWTFETSSSAPTITWPAGISWFGGSSPTISANKHYEISVVNNIAVSMEV